MQVTIHQIANLEWTLNSDHGLFHDLNHRRALILINPDISLTGPLETKPKEKQKNFQKMKQILNVVYQVAVILYRSNINRWCLLTSRCYNIT